MTRRPISKHTNNPSRRNHMRIDVSTTGNKSGIDISKRARPPEPDKDREGKGGASRIRIVDDEPAATTEREASDD